MKLTILRLTGEQIFRLLGLCLNPRCLQLPPHVPIPPFFKSLVPQSLARSLHPLLRRRHIRKLARRQVRGIRHLPRRSRVFSSRLMFHHISIAKRLIYPRNTMPSCSPKAHVSDVSRIITISSQPPASTVMLRENHRRSTTYWSSVLAIPPLPTTLIGGGTRRTGISVGERVMDVRWICMYVFVCLKMVLYLYSVKIKFSNSINKAVKFVHTETSGKKCPHSQTLRQLSYIVYFSSELNTLFRKSPYYRGSLDLDDTDPRTWTNWLLKRVPDEAPMTHILELLEFVVSVRGPPTPFASLHVYQRQCESSDDWVYCTH